MNNLPGPVLGNMLVFIPGYSGVTEIVEMFFSESQPFFILFSFPGSSVNGCFGQSIWLQIVFRVWDGWRFASLQKALCGSGATHSVCLLCCLFVPSLIHTFQ